MNEINISCISNGINFSINEVIFLLERYSYIDPYYELFNDDIFFISDSLSKDLNDNDLTDLNIEING